MEAKPHKNKNRKYKKKWRLKESVKAVTVINSSPEWWIKKIDTRVSSTRKKSEGIIAGPRDVVKKFTQKDTETTWQ